MPRRREIASGVPQLWSERIADWYASSQWLAALRDFGLAYRSTIKAILIDPTHREVCDITLTAHAIETAGSMAKMATTLDTANRIQRWGLEIRQRSKRKP